MTWPTIEYVPASERLLTADAIIDARNLYVEFLIDNARKENRRTWKGLFNALLGAAVVYAFVWSIFHWFGGVR